MSKILGLAIKGLESSLVSKLGQFFKGATDIQGSTLFDAFSKATSAASSAAASTEQFKYAVTPLKMLSVYLGQLSNDLRMKGEGLYFGEGYEQRRARQERRRQRRLDRLERRLEARRQRKEVRQQYKQGVVGDRKEARIDRRERVEIDRIKLRQAKRRVRQLGNLQNTADRIAMAKELGVDPEVATFMGFISGHGTVKPEELFKTVGELVDLISASVAKMDPAMGEKVEDYANDIMNQAEKMGQGGSGVGRTIRQAKRECMKNLKNERLGKDFWHPKGVPKYTSAQRKQICIDAVNQAADAVKTYDPYSGKRSIKSRQDLPQGAQYHAPVPGQGKKRKGKGKCMCKGKCNCGGMCGKGKKRRGTRLEVYKGSAMMTGGGLTKKDLVKRANKIISLKEWERLKRKNKMKGKIPGPRP